MKLKQKEREKKEQNKIIKTFQNKLIWKYVCFFFIEQANRAVKFTAKESSFESLWRVGPISF